MEKELIYYCYLCNKHFHAMKKDVVSIKPRGRGKTRYYCPSCVNKEKKKWGMP